MVEVQPILVAALALACICGSATAQNNCITASGTQINATALTGTWYEAVRNPVSTDALSCARVTLGSPDAQTLSALIQYSDVAGSPEMSVQDNWNVSLANFDAVAGYNVTINATSSVVYKLLLSDSNNYALVCGYTDASNASTIFGVILTRQVGYDISSIESAASLMYSLPQQSWSNVNQTACVLSVPTTTESPETTTTTADNSTATTPSTGGASGTSVSAIVLVTSAMYALLKFVH